MTFDHDDIAARVRQHLDDDGPITRTAAAYLDLYDEVKRLRGELAQANNEFGSETAEWPALWRRIAELKDISNDRWRRAEKAEAERDALWAAGDRLSVCAQTTGGTAGRDDGLVDAITGWKEARQALKGHNQ